MTDGHFSVYETKQEGWSYLTLYSNDDPIFSFLSERAGQLKALLNKLPNYEAG